jgi:hypothetical protein
MSRVEIRLADRKLKTTGDKVLRAELDLELRTNQNTWKRLRFLFDSGTEMTTMPAAEARRMDLPMPRHSVRGLAFRGQETRAGLLRARIVGLDLTEYTFPCDFLGDPAILPTDPNYPWKSEALGARRHFRFLDFPVLGRSNVPFAAQIRHNRFS